MGMIEAVKVGNGAEIWSFAFSRFLLGAVQVTIDKVSLQMNKFIPFVFAVSYRPIHKSSAPLFGRENVSFARNDLDF